MEAGNAGDSMMDNTPMVFKKDDIPSIWGSVKPFFENVIRLNEDYASIGFIHDKLLDGSYTLIAIHDKEKIVLAMVCEVVTCPTGRNVLMIPHLSGINMELWLPVLVDTLYALGADLSCEEVMISGGRLGWAREMKKYGGELSHVTIMFNIKDNQGKTYA